MRREDLSRIVQIQLGHLRRRLAGRRLGLELTPEATAWLAEHGYDPSYGARPLKRLIQTESGDRLAVALLEGGFTEGDTVLVGAGQGGLQLQGGRGADD